MPAVVADTGPVRYPVLIDAIDLLPRLFGRVLIPATVSAELCRPSTPRRVREWLAADPAWLERRANPPIDYEDTCIFPQTRDVRMGPPRSWAGQARRKKQEAG